MSNQIGGSRINGLLPAQIGEFRRSMSGGAFGPPMGQPYMDGPPMNQPYMDSPPYMDGPPMGGPYMPGTSLPGMGPPAGMPPSEMNGPPAGMPPSEMNGPPAGMPPSEMNGPPAATNNKSANNKSANNKSANNKSANNKSANNKAANNKSANNKSANNKNDSVIKILQDELYKQSQELYGIKLNKKNVPIWILILLSNILIIWCFIVTPIRYSNVKIVDYETKQTKQSSDEASIFSYNQIYYYLHMILLLILFIYGYSLSSRLPLIENNPSYTTLGLVSIIVIGVFIINITTSKPIIENGCYHSAPKHIYKLKNKMIAVHVLLVLLISTIIGYEIYKNPKNPLGLDRNLMGSSLVLALIGSIYLLINSIKYYVNKYNLPETWRK